MEFKEFKEEVLRRAKDAGACKEEYAKAYKAENFEDLLRVIKNNFHYAVQNGVIDRIFIEENREIFEESEIYCNRDASSGFLLVTDDERVNASGDVMVEAIENATVDAFEQAEVTANDYSKVIALGNVEVTANRCATVWARDHATVDASDNSVVRACDLARVTADYRAYVCAYDAVTVEADDHAIVRAYGESMSVLAKGNSCIISDSDINCKLEDNAIHRIIGYNTVKYASDNIRFEKQKQEDNGDECK